MASSADRAALKSLHQHSESTPGNTCVRLKLSCGRLFQLPFLRLFIRDSYMPAGALAPRSQGMQR